MKHYIRESYRIQLIVKKWDDFDIHDEIYIDGSSPKKPLDFNLHLAIALLQQEHLPESMLETLRIWARENKTAVAVE